MVLYHSKWGSASIFSFLQLSGEAGRPEKTHGRSRPVLPVNSGGKDLRSVRIKDIAISRVLSNDMHISSIYIESVSNAWKCAIISQEILWVVKCTNSSISMVSDKC